MVNSGTIYSRGSGGVGGDIEMIGGRVENSGTLDAASSIGDGGRVAINADTVILTDTSVVDVSSQTGLGGTVAIDATNLSRVAGGVDASGYLSGGQVTITGGDVEVNAPIDATGEMAGGDITIGGGFQGSDDSIRESSRTVVGADAKLEVSATLGSAGNIIVWSNGDTLFQGDALANASGPLGNGGLIEVSGLETLTFDGAVSATSVGGQSGVVLFDPGNLTIGNGLTGANQLDSATINSTLQGGTSVLLATQGAGSNITFQNDGLGDDRDNAIQWTNSDASFGAFAGGNIIVQTHIRTSGAGSINLMAGWTGTEAQAQALLTGNVFSPGTSTVSAGPSTVQDVFDFYAGSGSFGANGGSVVIGSATMSRHVEVGSRYSDTNVAAENVAVIASDTGTGVRYAQLGFRDSGTVFAPERGNIDLDDGTLLADNNPLVGVAGQNEVAVGGVVRGVSAINSGGVQGTTMVPYADHYMNANTGNWWWSRIEQGNPDPQGLGGNRPEMGAGSALDGADINVLATGSVVVQGGGQILTRLRSVTVGYPLYSVSIDREIAVLEAIQVASCLGGAGGLSMVRVAAIVDRLWHG